MKRTRSLFSSESENQKAVFTWAELARRQTPELELLLAVPNGGARNIVTARRLKDEGVKPGVPDMFLPVPRGMFHGLWIELKTADGKVSIDQMAWHTALQDQAYDVKVCYGAVEAISQLKLYLMLPAAQNGK
jgi:hypothetical protein